MNELWIERKVGDSSKISVRSNYHRDRSRVIHSSAFRRLQGKTQILALGESDFYRTRLTHSLEVAQISSGICLFLEEEYKTHKQFLNILPSSFLTDAIGLAHDLGHPPFGHDGERALNKCMLKHGGGGFEGNAQTLRVVTKLGEYSYRNGFDLTRRTLLGVMKYPILYSKAHNKAFNGDPPKCIFDEESEDFEWIMNPLSSKDKELLCSVEQCPEGHGRGIYKSLDCSIMDIADDIAYGVHDLEDALAMELVSIKEWDAEVVPKLREFDNCPLIQEQGKYGESFYRENLFSPIERARKYAVSVLVGHFINEVKYKITESFESPLLRFNVELKESPQAYLKVLKDFIKDNVIKRPQVELVEFKARKIITDLFEAYKEYPQLLPSKPKKDDPELERKVCDYIAGMTDAYASKQYQRLFMPEVGSIYDR